MVFRIRIWARLRVRISIDGTAVDFTAEHRDQILVIKNGLPGPIDLHIDPHADMIKGLVLKVDKMHLDSGEQAKVSFHRDGSGTLLDYVQITAMPFSKVFTIKVTGEVGFGGQSFCRVSRA